MDPSPSFHIRPAAEADVPLILQMIRELAEYEHLSDQVAATEELLSEWLFRKRTAEVLIGELDGKPVGYALFFHSFSTFVGRAGIYLEDLFVRPEARGQGCGKALFRKMAELCARRGYGRLEWACLNWNENSIRFYLSMGARPLNEWTVYRIAGDTLAALGKAEKSPAPADPLC